MKKSTFLLFWFLFFGLFINSASAHTPLQPDDNESLETAMVVTNPTKSWAVYAELHEGEEAQYYKLDLKEGEKLRVMLFIPLMEKGFMPNLVIMGLGISSKNTVPDYVEVPDGVGVMLVEANDSANPEYEPFTPSSYYYLADVDLEITVPGNYFVAVYEPSRGGQYGLAIGYREEFGLDEWLLIPIDVTNIHRWEGQSVSFILAPMVGTIVIGFFVLIWLKKNLFRTFRVWIVSLAGLLYIGSGFMTLVQMVIALSSTAFDISAILTTVFAFLPILLGLGILRFGLKDSFSVKSRAFTILFGLLGLFAWAGLLVGPLLAFLASVLPNYQLVKQGTVR